MYEEHAILTDTKTGFIIVVYEKKIFSRALDRKFSVYILLFVPCE